MDFYYFYCVSIIMFWTLLKHTSGKQCPVDWQLIDDVCFQYSNETSVTWLDAKKLCRTRYNSELIVLNRKSVYDNIKAHVAATGTTYWVGANRERSQDNYNWIDGTSLPSDNPFWLEFEPSKRNEKCVQLRKTNDTVPGLNDKWCGVKLGYICGYSENAGIFSRCHLIEDTCVEFIHDQKSSWFDAASECNKLRSGLLVIKENMWSSVIKIAEQYTDGDVWSFWVGAKFDEKSDFMWTDGSIVAQSLWMPGEPNGYERCVDIWKHPITEATGLNDEGCHERFSFICEMKYAFVRLVGGKSHTEGRLEIFHEGLWGTVCNDHFDRNAASVACRMLELPSSGAYHNLYGPGSGKIWLDDVKCIGNEPSLELCDHAEWGKANCGHQEDIGVVCIEAHNVKVRVVDGHSPYDGSLQIFDNNTWKPVCYSELEFSEKEVLCRMLGLDNITQAVGFRVNILQDVELVTITGLSCFGTETSFEHCHHFGSLQPSCDNDYQIGIYCIPECPIVQNCKNQTCTDEERTICNECEDKFNLTTDKQQCQMIQQPCPTVDSVVLAVGWVCAAVLLIIIIIIFLYLYLQKRKSEGKPSTNNDQGTVLLQVTSSTHATGDDEATQGRNLCAEGPDPSSLQIDHCYDMPSVYEEFHNRDNTEHLYGQT